MLKNNINKYINFAKMTYKMVIDTETTGLLLKNKETKKYYHPSNTEMYNTSRMVSIAWNLYDSGGNLHKSSYYIVKPDGFESHPEALKVHNITTEYATKNGIPIKNILDELYIDVLNSNEILAYNAMFDYNIILSEIYRIKMDSMVQTFEYMQENKQISCVMELSKKKIKNINAKYKFYPRMEEVYRHLFNDESFNTSHNALDDINICAKIYWYLQTI